MCNAEDIGTIIIAAAFGFMVVAIITTFVITVLKNL